MNIVNAVGLTGADGEDSVAPVFQVALETHQRPQGLLYLLTLVGDLDVSTAPDLQAATEFLRRALQPAAIGAPTSDGTAARTPAPAMVQMAAATVGSTVVLDLADLAFVDAAGLSALITVSRTTTAAGGTFCLLRPRPQAVRLFALTGADRAMPLCHDLAQALSTHRQPYGQPRRQSHSQASGLPASSPKTWSRGA